MLNMDGWKAEQKTSYTSLIASKPKMYLVQYKDTGRVRMVDATSM